MHHFPCFKILRKSYDIGPDYLCSEEEVCHLLKKLDVSQSTSVDGISARMLKETGKTISNSISSQFHSFYSIKHFPAHGNLLT